MTKTKRKCVKVENLRLVYLFFLGAIFAPTLLVADVDCSAVSRIERINQTIGYLRADPVSESARFNRAILVKDLAALSTQAATRALQDHTNRNDVNQLLLLVSAAHSVNTNNSDKTVSQFALSLGTERWIAINAAARVALSHMPCGDIQGRLAGDAEGREIDTRTVDRNKIAAQKYVVEKPVQTAILSIFLITGTAIAVRQMAAWLRYRAVLKKRRSKRFATQLDSYLLIEDTTVAAEVLDLSCHGAKVRYAHPETLEQTSTVGVVLDGSWRMGTLIWSNKHYLGVRFDKALPIPLVRTLAHVDQTGGRGRSKSLSNKEKAASV
jgi:hypothetical protein